MPPNYKAKQDKTTPKHITFKWQKVKYNAKILKVAKGKNTFPVDLQNKNYIGFSSETTQVGRELIKIFSVEKKPHYLEFCIL